LCNVVHARFAVRLHLNLVDPHPHPTPPAGVPLEQARLRCRSRPSAAAHTLALRACPAAEPVASGPCRQLVTAVLPLPATPRAQCAGECSLAAPRISLVSHERIRVPTYSSADLSFSPSLVLHTSRHPEHLVRVHVSSFLFPPHPVSCPCSGFPSLACFRPRAAVTTRERRTRTHACLSSHLNPSGLTCGWYIVKTWSRDSNFELILKSSSAERPYLSDAASWWFYATSPGPRAFKFHVHATCSGVRTRPIARLRSRGSAGHDGHYLNLGNADVDIDLTINSGIGAKPQIDACEPSIGYLHVDTCCHTRARIRVVCSARFSRAAAFAARKAGTRRRMNNRLEAWRSPQSFLA